jgi:hypothetical protein
VEPYIFQVCVKRPTDQFCSGPPFFDLELDRQDGIFPFNGQGVQRFAFIPAPIFSARPLHLEQEGRAQISRCASAAGGMTCQSAAARMGWRVVLVWCPLPMLLNRVICSLMVKEKLNIFFARPLTESGGRVEKMWGGVVVGITILECEAATICGGRPGLFSLANDADRGEPTTEEIG